MARDPEVVPVQFLDDSQVLLFDEYNPIDYSGSIPQAVKAAGGRYWSPYFKDICQADVDEAHGLGLRVSTWGADTNADIRQVLTMSVDSLTTGYVDRAFSQL
jgi:glycerophosphoryl diester phosphodiesterase